MDASNLKTCTNEFVAKSERHRRFMRAALMLAQRRLGRTWPNPSVGAVIVKNVKGARQIIATAATAPGGRPHAESQALSQAGEAARGADIYVTLEPCFHNGETPACSDAIVKAGIRRVFVGITDPDPRTCGLGIKALLDAGVEVICGVEEYLARRVHQGHINRITLDRPYVTLKLAISADGMIGVQGQGKVAISAGDANRFVHMLRARSDGIMVGTNTAVGDDPLLTCRLAGMEHCSPVRIILDRANRLPTGHNLFCQRGDVPVWSITGGSNGEGSGMSDGNFEYITCPTDAAGLFDLSQVLSVLAKRGITTLLVDGGARLATNLLAEGLVDHLIVITSKVVIGKHGVPAVTRGSLSQNIAAGRLGLETTMALGSDKLEIYRLI